MNKKITYVLLAVLVITGVWFFIQLSRVPANVQTVVYDFEIPIIAICMLATGFALAFPSLLFSQKEEKKMDQTEVVQTTEDEIHVQKATFSSEKLIEGLNNLKTNSLEKRFWYFCEYFNINLACLYKVEEDKNLKIEQTYGISIPEEDSYISGTDSLAALSLQSGKIEVVDKIPDHYFSVQSGLGSTKPTQLIFLPIEEGTTYVLELASFSQYDQEELLIMQESAKKVVA